MGDEKPRDDYLLERGAAASARLMFQHYAITRAQGWLLHPDVQSSVPKSKSLRIADLATGNAIWPFEAAELYPDAEVVGFDISDAQFPSKMTWPSNVRLELGDLFLPVPAKYQQYFDIVHVRLIVAAIYIMDKDVLLKNILSMIKPGGYIQWDELIEPTGIIVDENLNTDYKMAKWTELMYSLAGFRPATIWANTLPLVFEQYGLENIVGYKPPIKPHTLPAQTQSLTWSYREVVGVALKSGKANAEEIIKLANRDIEESLASGNLFAYAWIVAIGRKPVQT